ncbi:MAG: HNH endonuclease [Syntrophobacteraceae bacterium]
MSKVKGGQDTTENAVALCPNCHAKTYALKDASDVFNSLASMAHCRAYPLKSRRLAFGP